MSSRLPDEVLLKIFSLACTDAGKTGCALSAVSHHIRNISTEYRFQSVAITSETQLSALYSTLDAHSGTVYPIRHLYLGAFVQAVHAVYYILARAAPSLETLCLLDDGTRLGSASNTDTFNTLAEIFNIMMDYTLLNFTFPCLIELTIFGPLTLPIRKSDFAPKLQRLCISYDVVKSTEPLTHFIASTFPQLTHFRLSRMPPISGDEMRFLLSLALALGINLSPVGIHRDNPGIVERMPPPPPSRYLLIEQTQDSLKFASSAHTSVPGNDNVPYSILHKVHEHCWPFFILLPPCEDRSKNSSEEQKEDWLERIQGTAGCWGSFAEELGRV